MHNLLELTLRQKDGREEAVGFVCRNLYNAGYAGKDQEQVRRHIAELAELGVPAPTATPTIFPLSGYLLSNSSHIQVQHGETSGEVEYALLFQAGRIYVTVGCDHSDRKLEAFSVSMAKQACADVIAPEAWPYDEVKDHWDELCLRCWITKDGRRALYQDGKLSELLAPEQWLGVIQNLGLDTRNFAFFSGTIGTIGGLVYADSYEMELEDPVLDRRIRHAYTVQVLQPGIE